MGWDHKAGAGIRRDSAGATEKPGASTMRLKVRVPESPASTCTSQSHQELVKY